MNWDAIGAIGENIGAFAVVISVVYLAVQIRKQTAESRLAAARGTVETLVDHPFARFTLGTKESIQEHLSRKSQVLEYAAGLITAAAR